MTYVNEATTLSLICSSVISASGLVVIEQIWLDPNGKKVSEFSNYDMQFVNRSSAGVYTCVTKFMSNSGAEATVNASTQVVVNCTSIKLMIGSSCMHVYTFFPLQTYPK